MEQLKSGFKHTIICNKCHSRTTTQTASNQCSDFLIDPSFQRVDRLFALRFNDIGNRKGHSRYHLPTAKVEDYNVIIDGKTFLINQLTIT